MQNIDDFIDKCDNRTKFFKSIKEYYKQYEVTIDECHGDGLLICVDRVKFECDYDFGNFNYFNYFVKEMDSLIYIRNLINYTIICEIDYQSSYTIFYLKNIK
jgi:hypothetical protein